MNAEHFVHLHWPSHDQIKMLLIEVVKSRDEAWRPIITLAQADAFDHAVEACSDLRHITSDVEIKFTSAREYADSCVHDLADYFSECAAKARTMMVKP